MVSLCDFILIGRVIFLDEKGMLDNEFSNEISNKIFCPFEINQGIEMSLSEMYPDMQFYSAIILKT